MDIKQKIKFIIIVIIIALFLASILFVGVEPAGAASFNIDFLNLREELPAPVIELDAYLTINLEETWNFLNSKSIDFKPVTIGIVDTGLTKLILAILHQTHL